MGFIGSLMSGGQGAGFQAGQAQIQQPVDSQQATNQINQVNPALAQQQGFTSALLAQNPATLAGQAQLGQQLQGVASGQGPNPAQSALNQATGQNIAAQGALAAGQRGTGANVGMARRQAMQQGAATQQQAVGQAATLQAQQQLQAMQQLQGLFGQQIGQQQTGLSQNIGAQQTQQQALLNQINSQNQANVQMQSNMNSSNAQIAAQNAQTQGGLFGGLLGGVGSALGSVGGSLLGGGGSGGGGGGLGSMLPMLAMMSSGGEVNQDTSRKVVGGPRSRMAQSLCMGGYAKGGKVKALVSPGEIWLSPNNVKKVAQGANAKDVGKKIPGKAEVKGDSQKNDKVKANLQVGGIVVKRTASNSNSDANSFVKAVLAKKRGLKR